MPDNRLARAFASTQTVLSKVGPDQLDRPTPCASWDVRALIEHVVGSARWATDTIAITPGGPVLSYEQQIEAALTAFAADGAMERTVSLPFAELTGAQLMDLASLDQFVHGWDLARAIGLDTDLDPRLAADLLDTARVLVLDAYRGPDGSALFGPIVEPGPDARPADRLAAFLGRAA